MRISIYQLRGRGKKEDMVCYQIFLHKDWNIFSQWMLKGLPNVYSDLRALQLRFSGMHMCNTFSSTYMNGIDITKLMGKTPYHCNFVSKQCGDTLLHPKLLFFLHIFAFSGMINIMCIYIHCWMWVFTLPPKSQTLKRLHLIKLSWTLSAFLKRLHWNKPIPFIRSSSLHSKNTYPANNLHYI